MHFKTLKNKKAVSPIIATLLLILIAVAAGVIIYVWTTSYVGTQVGSVGGQETFVITNVKYTPNKIKVTIINQGSSPINITSANLYNETAGGTSVTASPFTVKQVINPGETKTIEITVTLAQGLVYRLEVTTAKGNTAVYRFTA